MRRLSLLAVPLLLAACAPGTLAIVRSFELVSSGGAVENAPPTTPGVQYLRVRSQKHAAYLALGYVEPGPQGNTEVWYSAKGEVLRLRNGRIVGTAGLATDWRDVGLPALPSWAQIGDTAWKYERTRDEMPDYRFGIAETVSVREVAPPKGSKLQDRDAAGLQWFEETVVAGSAASGGVPPSIYAVEVSAGKEVVVYSEACLSATVCLAWERLPEGHVKGNP